VLDAVLGEIVSFQPVVQYNQIYLFMIGIVAFLTQLQVLHLLRYHKTIAILSATLARALWDLISFGVIMGVIFFAFTAAIYFMYHDMPSYSTMSTAMGSQVFTSACNNFKRLRCYKLSVDFYCLQGVVTVSVRLVLGKKNHSKSYV